MNVTGDVTATVNEHIDHGQGARIDHILLSPSLAPAIVPGSYHVWASDLGNRASDHRMVSVRLDLGLLSDTRRAGSADRPGINTRPCKIRVS